MKTHAPPPPKPKGYTQRLAVDWTRATPYVSASPEHRKRVRAAVRAKSS